jgi:hypothetical protein
VNLRVAYRDACHLAQIIHEGFVNNLGLPDEQPISPATGNYLVAGGYHAVSPRTGDA